MYSFIMSFLSNVKYNYQKNNLKGLAKDLNKDKLNKFLEVLELTSKKTKKELIIDCFPELLAVDEQVGFFKNNIVWINGFHQKEVKLIKFFLKFYLKDNDIFTHQISSYHSNLVDVFNKNVSFDYLLNNSYVAQYLISIQHDYSFLTNYSAFFVSKNAQGLFAHKNLTNNYVYILRNPYDIYKDLKRELQNKDLALNLFLNSDGQFHKEKDEDKKYYIEIPKKNWGTHLTSWADPIVKKDFNGLILSYEDIFIDPLDFFASIVIHYKEKGLPINVDYELIKKFIDSNQNYFTKPSPDDLSNKEIKQINGVIGEILQSNNLSYRPKD